ncbi:MAG: RluA family pseudouridine synthase [Spirochaetes bacterium]|nr:RluA family pseudouridine synthase [Spirochaetota bacterium]
MPDSLSLDFTLSADDVPRDRLDRFLCARLPELNRSELKRRLQSVEVNGKPSKLGLPLRPGDHVVARLSAPPPPPPMAEAPAIETLYEDEHFLVVIKPEGLLVHGVPGLRAHTLVDLLRPKLSGERDHFSDADRPGIVHRLDRETSGLILFARTPHAEKRFLKMFEKRELEKRYLALVRGVIWQAEGVYDKPMGPDPGHALRRSVKPDTDHESAREAVTLWTVEERFAAHSLMRVQILTGRTHQVRVHFCDAGHPVVGDRKYGRNPGAEAHLFLCSVALAFEHPVTGEPMNFEIPPPPWFAERITQLRSRL